ncbi:Hypothetical predicted protein [Paramuricea clavata]|uniref:FP protein C-terminal domain-containing protein n=1 Tax=Paramuricea clavata TaxID=317549 RepID=A0A7D9DS91_PARCT|nr:Hypothetical predicted protein [Paramuricea clavata]
MAEIAQIEEVLKKELAPVHAKLAAVEGNLKQMTTSLEFLSTKYDQLLEHSKTTNEKITGLTKTTRTIQADIKINRDMTLEAKGESDELAQYLRRDCLEISGVKPNAEYSSEAIVENALPKIIVKFTRRNVRNKFYAERKTLAGKNLKDNPHVRKFLVGDSIYISESLTPRRKKLYGDINKFRKKFKWKFIWSHNGRIYIKKNEATTERYAFDTADDLAKFQQHFQALG